MYKRYTYTHVKRLFNKTLFYLLVSMVFKKGTSNNKYKYTIKLCNGGDKLT